MCLKNLDLWSSIIKVFKVELELVLDFNLVFFLELELKLEFEFDFEFVLIALLFPKKNKKKKWSVGEILVAKFPLLEVVFVQFPLKTLFYFRYFSFLVLFLLVCSCGR